MPSESTSVLKHIVSILDSFSIDHPELGVREVARLSSLGSSTAGRLMAGMKELGILHQNPVTRAYSIGSKMFSWSNIYVSTLNLRTIALPYMDDLRQLTNETVTLYILDGSDRLCVERMESQHNVRMVTRVGQKLPLYAGSAGKAILAFLSEEIQDNLINHLPLKPLTPKTITDPDKLRSELRLVREQGYAISYGEWLMEASGVAAPIFGASKSVVGALSISGPSPRFTQDRVNECAAAVVIITQKISELVGYSGENYFINSHSSSFRGNNEY